MQNETWQSLMDRALALIRRAQSMKTDEELAEFLSDDYVAPEPEDPVRRFDLAARFAEAEQP